LAPMVVFKTLFELSYHGPARGLREAKITPTGEQTTGLHIFRGSTRSQSVSALTLIA
jgi:hypothetical protein